MDELVESLRALVQATDRYRRVLAAVLDVGPGEASAMSVLLDSAPLSPSALARRLMLSPAGVTGLLDRLEAGGHVVRRRHPGDRRSTLVDLTPAGRRATRAMLDLFASDVAAALPGADRLRVAELASTLSGLSTRLRVRAADPAALGADMAREMNPGSAGAPAPPEHGPGSPEPSPLEGQT